MLDNFDFEVLDNFDCGHVLDEKLGVLDQSIMYPFSKLRKFDFLLQISLPVAMMIIGKDINLSSTMLQKSFQRYCEENDQRSTPGLHKILTFQNSALLCSCCVHMNKEQTVS